MNMNFKLIIILLLLFSPSVACATGDYASMRWPNTTQYNLSQDIAQTKETANYIGINSSNLPVLPKNENFSQPINNSSDHSFSESDNFDASDAGTDMVANGIIKGFTMSADDIYDQFGTTRGFIFSFITYNINPDNIPIAKDYNKVNTTTAVILGIIFIVGESLVTSTAMSNYPAYRNAFGEKDLSQQKYVGGGISVIAGLGATWIFRGVMVLINMIDAYIMFSVLDAIKPSLDNGLMYLAMAIIELLLTAFFVYRQLLIVAMFIAAPIYGVLWASGYLKEFVDSVGDKVIRALIMQPLCIFVTVVFILVMKSVSLEMLGITIWDGDNELTFYLILLVILFCTCWWCIFGKMTVIKRTGKMLLTKVV